VGMILPVILSGGSGSRLWPLSRKERPKQFLSLFGEQSLFQDTVKRTVDIALVSKPLVICNQDHRFLVAEQLQELGVESAAIMLEPIGRNTAPAITMTALQAMKGGEDPVLLVLPSDHVIENKKLFYAAVMQAKAYADKGKLITFGIVPKKPETGYGYIKAGGQLDVDSVYLVDQFVEKPDLKRAEAYLAAGNYYWNSGMFMFRASCFLEEIKKHAPDILNACRVAFDDCVFDADFVRLNEKTFGGCRSDSVDYAVMEKTSNAVVVPIDAGWSDVGSWSALFDISQADDNGNVTLGRVLTEDVKNSYLRSDKRLLAAIGVENLIVVETEDAVLIAHKDDCQKVKEMVAQLKSKEI